MKARNAGVTAFQKIKRDFVVVLYGLREATIDFAERVSRCVQHFKTYLAIDTLEANIKQNQALLGETAYRRNTSALDPLVGDPECMEICKRIKADQKQLHFLEDQQEKGDPMTRFWQDLRQSNSVVARVVVSDQFFGIGKKIKELSLPAEIRVIFVAKNRQVQIADEDLLIEAYDRITYVCCIEKENFYNKYWMNS